MKQLILMLILLIIINKTKLLGKAAADGTNGILKKATIAVVLKYLSNLLN